MHINPGLAAQAHGVADKEIKRVEAKHQQTGTDFESVMMSILVSNMRKSSFGEGLFPGDKSDTLGGLFDMMVADQIADSGGIGIKEMITDWLADAGTPRQATPTEQLARQHNFQSKAKEIAS